MAAFDPYHKWLGIPPAEQPVNHYRLLGVTLFESDPDVIDAATEQRVSYLRQCSTGQHIAASQKLLNEVAAARLCLLNTEKKRDYDNRLRKSLAQNRSAADPLASAVTPLIMPWEGQADDIVEDNGVPDFNSTATMSKAAHQGSRRTSSVVTPARMAVAVLLLGAVAGGIAIRSRRGNDATESNELQQASSPDNQPKVAQKETPPAKPDSPTAAITNNRGMAELKPTPEVGGKSSPRNHAYTTHAYAEPFNEKQTLDVYSPTEGKSRPIVFWIHGGGWQMGDKSEVELKPRAFTEKGFVFVSTNYRLLPSVTVQQIAGDVAKAIRWTHDHAKEFGGDPNTIFVMGHSAGAQMAALVCTDDRYLKFEGLSLSNIKGCVPVDGDTFDVPMQIAAVEQRVAEIYMRKFGIIALQKELSPVTHVAKGKGIPPVLILYVANHPETKPQAQRFASVLQASGVSAKAYPAENKTHATINSELGQLGDKPTSELFEFMDRELKSLRGGDTVTKSEVTSTASTPNASDSNDQLVTSAASSRVGVANKKSNSADKEQLANESSDRFSKAIEKANSTREAAQKKAAAELLTAIDREIELTRKKKLDASGKNLLIQILTTERRAFENRTRIPWAPALRKATIEYLKEYNTADKPVAVAFDAAISHFIKNRDDGRAAALQKEKTDKLAPWMIGTWEINNPARKLVHAHYSNGRIDQPDGKNRFEFANDKLVLYYDTPKSATGAWVTQCTISDDGRTMSAKEQNGVTSSGQRIDNPGK